LGLIEVATTVGATIWSRPEMAMAANSRSRATAILSVEQTPRENNKPNQESANEEPAHWKFPIRQLEVSTR